MKWAVARRCSSVGIPAFVAIRLSVTVICGCGGQTAVDVTGAVSGGALPTGGAVATAGGTMPGGMHSTDGTKSTGGAPAIGGAQGTGGMPAGGEYSSAGGSSDGARASGGSTGTGGSQTCVPIVCDNVYPCGPCGVLSDGCGGVIDCSCYCCVPRTCDEACATVGSCFTENSDEFLCSDGCNDTMLCTCADESVEAGGAATDAGTAIDGSAAGESASVTDADANGN
jgi:hypothetical protein